MKLRTFQGRTMAEALDRVKGAFGKDAVVLSTRTTDRQGVLGSQSRGCVEITAARDVSDLPPALRPGTMRIRSEGPVKADGAADTVRTPRVVEPTALSVAGELHALKSLVADLVARSHRDAATPASVVPAELAEFYRRLVHNSLAEELAASLVQRVQASLPREHWSVPMLVRARLAEFLEPMVPAAGGIALRDRSDRPTVVALVGPTGVGKTTTIAKLAAHYTLRERCRVGLVTIDTYRMAAVEQLRTYAQIMDVPLEVAATPTQLSTAIARMGECDLILVDTAGRGQRDADRIAELHQFFLAHRPDEMHLVLAGTAGERVLHQTIESFSTLGIDRMIFSKLDEAIGFGVILSCLQRANAKLSYVTTGQNVPDDLEIAAGDRIAQCIVEGTLDRAAWNAVSPVQRSQAAAP